MIGIRHHLLGNIGKNQIHNRMKLIRLINKGGMLVNRQRALEIVESPEMIHVTYQGTPIYIQHVNPDEGTARIYPLNDRETESEVPLANLEEQ